jgi:hypothetical protein
VRVRRAFAYAWALPTTAVGLILVGVSLVTGARVSVVDGVMEAHGGVLTPMLRRFVPLRGGASAMTLGHVVVARDVHALDRTRAHERAHVRQVERWGPFFLPAYLVASLIVATRGGHYYWDNRFERDAVAVAALANELAAKGTPS